MSSKLKTFIDMNREQLDSFAPSADVWQKIDAAMQQPAFIKSKISWLKYFGYGASAIVAVLGLRMLLASKAEITSAPAPVNVAAALPPAVQHAVPADTSENSAPAVPVETPKPAETKQLSAYPGPQTEIPVAYALPAIPGTPVTPIAPVVPVLPVAPFVPVAPVAFANYQNSGSSSKQVIDASYKIDTSFTGISRLEVSVSSCDIDVKPSGTALVNFKAAVSSKQRGLVFGDTDYEIIYERKDSVLKIRLQNKGKKQVVIAGSTCLNASMSINVPDNISLSIDDSYGDVNVNNIKSRSFELMASSGNVTLENTKGDLKLDCRYGNVFLKEIKGNLKLTAGSGNVSLMNLDGNSDIHASYGSVLLKKISGSSKINSGSGNVSISEMNGDLEIISRYGDILLQDYAGTPTLEAGSGNITGKNVELKKGMTTKSTYGSIYMKLLNNYSDLSFDLSTRYGTISIPGTKVTESGKLLSTKGNILIKGYSGSGDQNYQ